MTSCPELQSHVDDAVKALRAYQVHRSEGADGPAKFDLMLLEDALDQALKQAWIEVNALHDPAGGAW